MFAKTLLPPELDHNPSYLQTRWLPTSARLSLHGIHLTASRSDQPSVLERQLLECSYLPSICSLNASQEQDQRDAPFEV